MFFLRVCSLFVRVVVVSWCEVTVWFIVLNMIAIDYGQDCVG